jgi:thiamine biosynthesis lipoprotein
MGTRFEFVLVGDDPVFLRAAGEEALDEVERLEAQLSRFRPDSEISGINARAAHEPVVVEPRLFAMFERIGRLWAATDGAFDPTVGALMRAYEGAFDLPADPASSIGWQHVSLDPDARNIRFQHPGIRLDLGAIGKGYAIDQAALLLREAGVEAALLHAGTSSVVALGTPPGAQAWTVAIRDPLHPDRHLARVPLRGRSLSVSAPHGKFLTVGDRQLGHVLDPRTGLPVESTLLAAVVTESATDGDALSTALLALGVPGLQRLHGVDPNCEALVAVDRRDVENGDAMEVSVLGAANWELCLPQVAASPSRRDPGE